MFKSVNRKLKNNERVHFNYGSKQTEATVKIISEDYVQFKFDEPIPVKRCDKYIVRFISPQETFGGGIILNVDSKRYKIENNLALNHFKSIDSNNESIVSLEIINDSSAAYPEIDFVAKKLNVSISATIEIIKSLLKDDQVTVIDKTYIKSHSEIKDSAIDADSIVVSKRFFEGIKKYIIDILNKYHKDNPISKGLKKQELKNILFKRYSKVGDTVFEKLINYLITLKVIKQFEDLISVYEFSVVLDDEKTENISGIEKKYYDSKFEMPQTSDVVNSFANNNVKNNDKLQIRQMIVDLAKSGKLVKLSNDYYIHKKHYDFALSLVKEEINNNGQIKMSDLRDRLNTSRKYAIIILDYMDSKHITELRGDVRIKGVNFDRI